jgi:hypothetical protein
MKTSILVLLVIGGLLLLGISVYFRTKSDNKYELKSIDIALLLLPIVFFLFFTGKIGKVNLFGVELETASVIIDASRQPIESQIVELEGATIDDMIRTVEVESKGGVNRIPELIEKKTEALQFRLGHGGYYGPAIQEYFESLTAAAHLKYVVINDDENRLFGFLDAREMMSYFEKQGDNSYQVFANRLNRPNERSVEGLKSLPGFIPLEKAINSEKKKRDVLQMMDELNIHTLPVVNEENIFLGIVERSRLTASLMIEIFDKLDSANAE